jgi:hypothetical protein
MLLFIRFRIWLFRLFNKKWIAHKTTAIKLVKGNIHFYSIDTISGKHEFVMNHEDIREMIGIENSYAFHVFVWQYIKKKKSTEECLMFLIYDRLFDIQL